MDLLVISFCTKSSQIVTKLAKIFLVEYIASELEINHKISAPINHASPRTVLDVTLTFHNWQATQLSEQIS